MSQIQTADFFPAAEANRNFQKNLAFQEQFDKELASGFENRIRAAVRDAGVPPRLQKATPTIPKEISSLRCFQGFPSKNFGLVGPGGCGKSCAIAWSIKNIMRQEMEEAGPNRIIEVKREDAHIPGQPFQGTRQINAATKTTFRWIGWPAFASRMKSLASRRAWEDRDASVEALIQWVCFKPESRVLILDDIGMETIKPESYTSEQLELLIDEAYNHDARVIWTSNKRPEDLEKPEAYGYRLVSRLTGLAPDALLPATMPDLRIRATE